MDGGLPLSPGSSLLLSCAADVMDMLPLRSVNTARSRSPLACMRTLICGDVTTFTTLISMMPTELMKVAVAYRSVQNRSIILKCKTDRNRGTDVRVSSKISSLYTIYRQITVKIDHIFCLRKLIRFQNICRNMHECMWRSNYIQICNACAIIKSNSTVNFCF